MSKIWKKAYLLDRDGNRLKEMSQSPVVSIQGLVERIPYATNFTGSKMDYKSKKRFHPNRYIITTTRGESFEVELI